MAYRDEIDDGFDAVVFLEERCYEEGHKRGYQDGLLKGMEEGRELGMVKGSEVGGEVGFYLGFVSLWLEILNETPDPKQRHIKLLETLKEMISSLPINDVTSEELFVNLEKIRAKYKQVLALIIVVVRLEPPSEIKLFISKGYCVGTRIHFPERFMAQFHKNED